MRLPLPKAVRAFFGDRSPSPADAALLGVHLAPPQHPLAKSLELAAQGRGLSSWQPTGMQPDARPGALSFDILRRSYETHDITYAIIETSVADIVGQPFAIQPKREEDWVAQGTLRGITDLFETPNAFSDWPTLNGEVIRDLRIYDAGAIEKVYRDGKLVALYSLDGSTLYPQMSPTQQLLGYVQRIRTSTGEKKEVTFAPHEIAYFRLNPLTHRKPWGFSPLEACAMTVAAEMLALRHNAAAFTDGNLAKNLMLFYGLGQAEIDKIVAFFEENKGRGGTMPMIGMPMDGKAEKIALLPPLADMEYKEFSQWMYQRECGAYGVSPDRIIPLKPQQTKAGAETQQEVHTEVSIKPLLQRLEAAWTRQIVREITPLAQFTFVDSVHASPTEQATTFKTRIEAGWPLNRALQDAGEDTIEGPTVTINGEPVNLYDLPINPTTGEPWGMALMPEGAPPAETPGLTLPGMNGHSTNGGDGGSRLPWAKARATAARRLPDRAQSPRLRDAAAPGADRGGVAAGVPAVRGADGGRRA